LKKNEKQIQKERRKKYKILANPEKYSHSQYNTVLPRVRREAEYPIKTALGVERE
jgi:hypothetical protein